MNHALLLSELKFKAVRSSGSGGQHVNKVSSKVVLTFDLKSSEALNQNEKDRLCSKLSSRLTNDGVLILACEESKSQVQNKKIIINRLFQLLKTNLIVPKVRLKSKPSRASIKKVKENKRRRSELKSNRKKPNWD